jgi:hypothetical protein
MAGDQVRLTVVAGEFEAEEICGLLRSEEIACFSRPTDVGSVTGLGGGFGGPHEILVAEEDLERALALLEPVDGSEEA